MVADKEFYYSIYHGKLPQTDVEGCLSRAEYMLHSLTLDRLAGRSLGAGRNAGEMRAHGALRAGRTPSTPRTRPCWRAEK